MGRKVRDLGAYRRARERREAEAARRRRRSQRLARRAARGPAAAWLPLALLFLAVLAYVWLRAT